MYTVYFELKSDFSNYEKCIKAFTKSVARLPVSDSGLQKILFDFGKSCAFKSKAGKRKRTAFIPVQSTSRARRTYVLRGSRAAPQGRPKLGKKVTKPKDKHDLLISVMKNKGATKKH